MAKILERRERLLHAADELQRECFGKSVQKLMEEYGKEENRRAVIQMFEELTCRWKELHKDPADETKAASLGITYCLSSILTKSYAFRLYLYGKEFWLEEKPAELIWKPPYFFEFLEGDMVSIVKGLGGSFPRLCRAEEDAVMLQCADYYLAAVQKLCEDMAEEIMDSMGFRELKKTEDFFLFFGRFQGEGEKIWNISS